MIHSHYGKDENQKNFNSNTNECSKSKLIEGMIKKIFEFIDITIDNFNINTDYVK